MCLSWNIIPNSVSQSESYVSSANDTSVEVVEESNITVIYEGGVDVLDDSSNITTAATAATTTTTAATAMTSLVDMMNETTTLPTNTTTPDTFQASDMGSGEYIDFYGYHHYDDEVPTTFHMDVDEVINGTTNPTTDATTFDGMDVASDCNFNASQQKNISIYCENYTTSSTEQPGTVNLTMNQIVHHNNMTIINNDNCSYIESNNAVASYNVTMMMCIICVALIVGGFVGYFGNMCYIKVKKRRKYNAKKAQAAVVTTYTKTNDINDDGLLMPMN